jgi:hypothetical protein
MEWRNTSLEFPSASSWSEHSGGGGMEATSPGRAVVGRGARPSPEMLWGSGALPTRESDNAAPPRRESISFCRCGQREFDSGDVASFGQRSSFLRRRWRRRRRLYGGWGVARQAGASGSGGDRSGQERLRQDEDANGFRARMRGLLEGTVICRAPIFSRPPRNPNFGPWFRGRC